MTIGWNGLTLEELETVWITTGTRYIIEDGEITGTTYTK